LFDLAENVPAHEGRSEDGKPTKSCTLGDGKNRPTKKQNQAKQTQTNSNDEHDVEMF